MSIKYEDLISSMERFGSTKRDICIHGLGITPEQVQENVVIAPWWEPSGMPGLGAAEYLSESDFASIKVWNIKSDTCEMTYIKTGIGAPVLMDVLLSLGVTPCRRIIFIGSVGSLNSDISIGDIVIPDYSVCGDGASRYIASNSLEGCDVFGEKVYPNLSLSEKVKEITGHVCTRNGVKWHNGITFSIDTIVAQFLHIDKIINSGCNTIEMETAAAFRAASLIEIPIAALFSVSDNTVTNKSLISGRTPEENEYRKRVRREIFPEIILSTFAGRLNP